MIDDVPEREPSFPCEIGRDDAAEARRWDEWKTFVVTAFDGRCPTCVAHPIFDMVIDA